MVNNKKNMIKLKNKSEKHTRKHDLQGDTDCCCVQFIVGDKYILNS